MSIVHTLKWVWNSPSENHQPATSHWHILSHNVLSSTPFHDRSSNSQH
jgi:hypothetical protein